MSINNTFNYINKYIREYFKKYFRVFLTALGPYNVSFLIFFKQFTLYSQVRKLSKQHNTFRNNLNHSSLKLLLINIQVNNPY